MKIIGMMDLAGTDREVKCPNGGFISYRALLERDGMGFSLHKTVIPEGPPQHWHYKHHLEACYCVSGGGVLKDLRNGAKYLIAPDMLYVLNKNDDHTFEAWRETVLICIFNPPLVGPEVHAEDGSYE